MIDVRLTKVGNLESTSHSRLRIAKIQRSYWLLTILIPITNFIILQFQPYLPSLHSRFYLRAAHSVEKTHQICFRIFFHLLCIYGSSIHMRYAMVCESIPFREKVDLSWFITQKRLFIARNVRSMVPGSWRKDKFESKTQKH